MILKAQPERDSSKSLKIKTRKVRKPCLIKLSDDQSFYNELVKEMDVPEWYRGLSQFQMDAANSLLSCLRDDSEQGTTHRTREALLKLGVRPLVAHPKMQIALRLSRGNDIAFLWFLMELYYQHGCDECEHVMESEFTINQQLIMSTIVHLDLIPTLRELDRLLPKQPEQPKPKKVHKKKQKKQKTILPYFEKQTRPSLYGEKLTANERKYRANFSEYINYLNPSYVVPNESNRWYSDYKFSPCRKLAAKTSAEHQLKDIFQQENSKLISQRNPILCSNQLTAEAIKKGMSTDLAIAKKKLSERLYDENGQLKDDLCQQVLDKINEDIEKAQENFDRLAKGSAPINELCVDKNEDDEKRHSKKSKVSEQATYNENFTKCDYEHSFVPSAKKKVCFEAASNHKPYKLVYQNIFDLSARDPIKDVEKALAKAIDGKKDEPPVDHSQAVRNCCKRIWAALVQKYKEDCRKEIKINKIKRAAVNLFDLPNYDPYDSKLMTSMLLKAFEEMKKNKKFVLVTLPDAHKIPKLKAWIRKRYGYVYTRKERKRTLIQAKKIFMILGKAGINVKIPQLIDIGKSRVISYGCREYLAKKIDYLKEKYRHNYTATLLEHSRIYWGSVRPYQCSHGTPRVEFFSYLPARVNDVHMFRPWRPSEYVHAKDEWDRRQRILRQKLVY